VLSNRRYGFSSCHAAGDIQKIPTLNDQKIAPTVFPSEEHKHPVLKMEYTISSPMGMAMGESVKSTACSSQEGCKEGTPQQDDSISFFAKTDHVRLLGYLVRAVHVKPVSFLNDFGSRHILKTRG
jgi:hypothetical protein